MLPVLLLGSWIGHKSYPWRDYIVAGTVMTGCAVFLSTGVRLLLDFCVILTDQSGSAHQSSASSDTPLGLFLMLLYLGFDGATSTLQERLFRQVIYIFTRLIVVQFKMSTSHQMIFVNFFSLSFAAFSM
jgi:hypothetical protein